MTFLAVVVAFLVLFAALLFLPTLISTDPLNVNIPVIFARLLLKYIPGYTAPLKADHTAGVFTFEPIRIAGKFLSNEQDIAIFDRAVRSSGSPFFLLAKTTPLIIQLLADRRCPIKPLGAVNTRNVIKLLQQHPLLDTELTYVATFGSKPGIRRKRGVEVVITIDVMSADKKIVEMELWMLQFLPSTYEPRFKGESLDTMTTGESICSIKMTTQDPRLWARSCKDYNPIHISKLGAQLFGFKSVIAHGNHVAALALQESGVPERPFTLELEFMRPMFLPSTLEVLRARAKQTNAEVLTVVSGVEQRAHMRMSIKSSDR